MKGTFFQKPFEFKLAVEGESWRQGDAISGSLSVKNHGAEEVSIQDLQISLVHGNLNEVRLKRPEAFEIISTVSLGIPQKLRLSQEKAFPWNFQTDRNCPITDKSGSLFLLYGISSAAEKQGQIQLPVIPANLIEEFIKTLQTQFRFVVKTQKFNRGNVEVKLAPPTAREFVAVEQLVLLLRFEGEKLETRYTFQVKKIEALSGTMNLKKDKKDFQQSFEPSDYRLPSGRYNHERIEGAVREILGTFGSG